VGVEPGTVREAHASRSDRDESGEWTAERFGDSAWLIRPPRNTWQRVYQPLKAVPAAVKAPIWTVRRVLFLVVCALLGFLWRVGVWLVDELRMPHGDGRVVILVLFALGVAVIMAKKVS
jgi:hypothetical protein